MSSVTHGPATAKGPRSSEAAAVSEALYTYGFNARTAGRLAFGTVADDVLRYAPCPILLVGVSPAHEE